jgi:uncharacterized protein YjbJ (UPF0337 family)
MGWERIEGSWKQLKGRAQVKWGKFTDDPFHVIAGRREQLMGHLQERNGVGKEEAEKQVEFFVGSFKEEDFRRVSRHACP